MLPSLSKSTFPTRRKLSDAINKILRPYVKACRDIVLVGHDINQDIQYLESIGIAILEVKGMSLVVDSQSTHQAWKKSSNGRSLSAVLADLAIESKNLHNAGNDAVFTMRALIGVAIEDIRQKKVEEGGGTYEPPF
ncbi:good for full dbp5 protein 2 [Geosmithia morbida]|uniref:Good for full dbp5 protein 2 n=1 Tax=Geosmithia morbida TaxID=1094350 RepID=A0A9P4YT08_9HYPO|nr:good for full dbp5 protein 2 [Geosmithia morbida]KAF4121183.1 good for full dbp5 protein 2 [Geosmithia morbida]